FLKKILSCQKKGKALDLAMGKGRNSFFLAQNGYEVEGIELSKESIAECQKQIGRKGLPIKIIEADLEKTTLPKNAFDLVICFFYLQRDLFPQIKETLKQNGFVAYETFLIDQHIQRGSPRRVEFCLSHNELLNFFRGFRIHFYEEGKGEGDKITARIIAQKI
ncbi:MAG: class I SAM-dependent methyltransferase, partial [Nitrospiria bacterium]